MLGNHDRFFVRNGAWLALAAWFGSASVANAQETEGPFLERVGALVSTMTPDNVHVLGECGNIGIDFPGFSYSVQGCVLDDGDRLGIAEASGAGVLAVPGVSGMQAAVLSNANDIWGYAGPQICATVAGSWGPATAGANACFTVQDSYELSQNPLTPQLDKQCKILKAGAFPTPTISLERPEVHGDDVG